MTTPGWSVPPANSRSCDRCGHVGTDVAPSLARTPDGRYEAIDRCRDHRACTDRLREPMDAIEAGTA